MEELAEQIREYYAVRNKRAVFQLGEKSLFIIISQAPGKKVDQTGIPWNDVSGKKLREWLGVTEDQFYNKNIFSIMPIDFCFPGTNPKGGDYPPDPTCAAMWHPKILSQMPCHPLKLLIGSYAINYYLKDKKKESLSETIKSYKEYIPDNFPMVHPSPRNKNWLKKNDWFEKDNIPFIRRFIKKRMEENHLK